MPTQKRKKREPWPFGSSFSMFFPPPGPALCKVGWPGVLFVPPEVLTPVLGPSFLLFSWAFPFLVFQPPPFWTPVSYSTCLTIGHLPVLVSLTSLGMILSTSFPEAGLGIVSHLAWSEILHCVHVPHPLFPFMCFYNYLASLSWLLYCMR